jgi:nucleotide-binding universal stress UspA family protein
MDSANPPAGSRGRQWLLAVDGSAPADEAARHVARWAPRLAVTEVCVVSAQPIGSFRAYALNRDEVLKDAADACARAASHALAMLDAAGVPRRFEAKVGDPTDAIVGEARVRGVNEIVLGTHGLGQLSGALLGSVAYKVVHFADVPVTLVPLGKPDTAAVRDDGVHRVLVPYDGSEAARRAVDYVATFAGGAAPVEAHVVNVEKALATARVTAAGAEAADEEGEVERRALLAEAEAKLAAAGIRCIGHLARGPLADTLLRLSDELDCARIVMGKRGVGGFESLMVGSLAYAVAHLSPRPVTLVK